MDSAAIRKGSLRAFLLFLILTALIAMSSAAFMEKRKGKLLGRLGILLAAAAAILLIGGLWSRNAGDPYWQAATCG